MSRWGSWVIWAWADRLEGAVEVITRLPAGQRPKIPSQNAQKSRIIRDMGKNILTSIKRDQARVLGAKVFAAIAAVEGLHLNAASKKRLAALRASSLTPDERRAEILRAYATAKVRR